MVMMLVGAGLMLVGLFLGVCLGAAVVIGARPPKTDQEIDIP